VRSTQRIKARILKQAVADNVDAIHDRLPKPLRPPRRRLHLLVRWGSRAGLPVAIVMALSGTDRWSAAMKEPTRAAETRVSAAAAVRVAAPDTSALSERVPPGVLALAVRRIVVDAGHGGEHLGTSSAGGLQEKDLTLDIAARLRRLMVARGVEVVMTREVDRTLSLQQRAAIANDRRGDVFVSIHLNSLQPLTTGGIETYYLGPSSVPELDAIAARENQHSGYSLVDLRALLEQIYTDARRTESRRLAHAVHQSLMRRLVEIEPALVDRGVKMSPFVVLIATEMPAILAEVSTLSNADEARRLGTPEYRQAIAEALAGGITTFAGSRD
jgi:N-acetylmuramoyl-L-alanine amidase